MGVRVRSVEARTYRERVIRELRCLESTARMRASASIESDEADGWGELSSYADGLRDALHAVLKIPTTDRRQDR
jgi:hypothetical protein